MTFSIAKFSADITKNGVLKNNRFVIDIPVPAVLAGRTLASPEGSAKPINEFPRLVQFRGCQAHAPGIYLNGSDDFRYGIGVSQKHVQGAFFNDVTFSFICDRNGSLYKYFYAWMASIFDFGGYASSGNGDSSYQAPTFGMEYRDNYVVDPSIQIFDDQGRTALNFVLRGAYPYRLAEKALDWAEKDQIMMLTVMFTYKSWGMIDTSVKAPTT